MGSAAPRVRWDQPPAVAGNMQQAVRDALIAFMAATSQAQAQATKAARRAPWWGHFFLLSVDGVLIADPVTYDPEDDQDYNKVEHTTYIRPCGAFRSPWVRMSDRR